MEFESDAIRRKAVVHDTLTVTGDTLTVFVTRTREGFPFPFFVSKKLLTFELAYANLLFEKQLGITNYVR